MSKPSRIYRAKVKIYVTSEPGKGSDFLLFKKFFRKAIDSTVTR